MNYNYLILFLNVILLIWLLKLINYKEKKIEGYYVYCPQASAPQYVHETYKSAHKEAKRLHCKYPYNDFQILKIEYSIASQPVKDDEIPF